MVSARTEQWKAGLIDDLAALARERLAPGHAEPAVRFVRQDYLGVAADDLAESHPWTYSAPPSPTGRLRGAGHPAFASCVCTTRASRSMAGSSPTRS